MKKEFMMGAVLSLGLLAGCGGANEESIQTELEPESLNAELENQAERNAKEESNKDIGKDQPKFQTNIDTEYYQYELERSRPKNGEAQKDYPDSLTTPISDKDANSYNNKEYDKQSREIGKRLSESRFVKTAQVVVTNDAVIVAVEEPDRATYTRVDVAEKVRAALKEMPETKGKEIVVYTDERYWDRMKDLKSRINQDEEMPDGVDQFRDKNYR
ncbi:MULTISPECIES: YhcN/YlaJ family sporulation lipoprotein [Pontibacillus]|uniref:YhcN/YlaJ family sporulation lipoprotein n=1 Tax=Pontibacillus chungwhensis TaxID=265426 RepID=A0ABY8UUU9_9BACI|nr:MULTISPECIES: YhcN/YlaJ family sporulation lipoprotein [Pontibacillus]MCD5323708.1 YhcN/YlaJ family sporulation lipoprotein [Pontibacillus sp. HN14]WIF97073.1 YhcN/YlaJ family sporulation lipoprotein [Pontibacillus chungwhensis]